MSYDINWWKTDFIEEEIAHIGDSIRNRCVSQGKVTEEFEQKLSKYLNVSDVICVSSGSTALLISLMAIGIKPGDEVIVPNRTWIATAHAVYILGAKPIFVDVSINSPIIDISRIVEKITSKTKAIIPVSLNGRFNDMNIINKIAKKYNLYVIEDAAQAIGSENVNGKIGTQSDIGCFSLSVAKTINTGQGGFTATNNKKLANKIRAIRTHGVEQVKDPRRWVMPGFNFRYTDILASIGLEQLSRIEEKISHVKKIYNIYEEGLRRTSIKVIPVDLGAGEIPVYNEVLVENRANFIKILEVSGIESRQFYPSMNRAEYFNQTNLIFKNSEQFEKKGLYLPSGPSQSIENVNKVVNIIRNEYL